MKLFSIAVLVFGVFGINTVSSQTIVETKIAPAPTAKVGNATIAPSATTTYTQPGTGPTGNPIPGNQSGSSSSTSYGATVTIPLPDGTKNKK